MISGKNCSPLSPFLNGNATETYGPLKSFPSSSTNRSMTAKKLGVVLGKVVVKKSLAPCISCVESTDGIMIHHPEQVAIQLVLFL